MKSKIQTLRFLLGIAFALAMVGPATAQSPESRQADACERNTATAKASRLIDLESLARAELHAEALRGQLFEVQMREIELQTRVDDLDYDLTPDRIQWALALVGSARPMDELRDALRTRLESEKARLNKQLELLDARSERLEAAIQEADAKVERLRELLGSN